MQFDAWTKLVHHKVFTETTISMGQTKPPPYPCTLCKAIRPRADVVDTTKKGSIGWWCAQRRFFYGLKDAWFYLSPKELGGYFNGTVGGISPTPFLSPSSAGAFDWYFVIDDDTIVNLYALQDFLGKQCKRKEKHYSHEKIKKEMAIRNNSIKSKTKKK